MLQLVLAVSAFTVATAVYAVIGLRWWRRARKRRAVLALVAALDLEPYHASALKSEEVEAAAAELLLGGYLDIDGPGAARLTEEGREPGRPPPAHPLPAALLEAVRRYDPEPVSIGWINRYDAEYQIRRQAYEREQDALLPPIPRIPRDPGEPGRLMNCCGCVGIVLLVGFWCAVGMLLVLARPHGVRGWAAAVVAAGCLAALGYAEVAGRAVRARTACEDPLGDRVRTQCHPALAALDERQRLRIRRSADDDRMWRGAVDEDDDLEDDLEDDLDDDWWADAYHYRAADDDEPDGKPLG
ncbi:hypothetical protein Snoj_37870 [Streptomyces nojiriensis]|uniref:TIGR04222 domain-containing membrane protein n=1 Tax=Streptomyces nojiriensis TaxID=66374 RepID=A0ABQ3SP06_9ACTN|nr:hypothetical protein [Streptomyces nojiriensis]QTI43417.1 hypothetical protein JYK04_01179 [Streptomyces nojiriensis]GGS12716.1 hypothetical protein GCM10010205_48240 [Streptomyces nojiriensis]GHI69869.1 hypothetical protein Snoj_37870 [Streptomyces nojiriensis]